MNIFVTVRYCQLRYFLNILDISISSSTELFRKIILDINLSDKNHQNLIQGTLQ